MPGIQGDLLEIQQLNQSLRETPLHTTTQSYPGVERYPLRKASTAILKLPCVQVRFQEMLKLHDNVPIGIIARMVRRTWTVNALFSALFAIYVLLVVFRLYAYARDGK